MLLLRITDMGEVGDRGSLGQVELGCSDHCCNLRYLPSNTTGGKWKTTEV